MKANTSPLSKNVLWIFLGSGLPLVVGLFTIPIVMGALGLSAFGILTLIWTAIGYFGLFDFGLGRALTQKIAAQRAHGKTVSGAWLKRGLWVLLIPGILGAIVMHWASIYYVNHVLHLDAEMAKDAKQAFVCAAWAIPLVTVGSGLRGILEGFESFEKASLLRGILGTLNFALPLVLVLYDDHGLLHLVWSLVLARCFVVLLNLWWLRSALRMNLSGEDQEDNSMKSLLNFGVWMTVSNLVGPFMVAADRFVVASFVGTSVLAYYTVPQDFVLRLLLIPAAVATAWFPRIALTNAAESYSDLRKLLRKGLQFTGWIMGPLCLLLMLGSKPLLEIWLNTQFANEAWQVAIVLMLGIFVNAMAHIPLAALQATGQVKQTALLHVLELIFYIPLLCYVLPLWGIMGAAIVWSMRCLIDFLCLYGLNYYYLNERAKLLN